MSADIYTILEMLSQQQQQQQVATGYRGRPARPRVSDIGVNTVPHYDSTGGAIMLDTVL